ncbi:MAG TPA: selenium metabolism-associated LysR family transcriptional regulator [Nitrospirota bacterium]|nr:selenium metabolism-associated LysR family transcriptional regulator [Nitrospirota bacterium]
MELHHLRIFLSVFKNKSFSKASQELRLSQPTISEHIKTLEQELNCPLFERLGRKIIATREADALHNFALDLVERADSVKSVLGRFKKEVAGDLIIGASTIPGTYLLPERMAAFKRKHPAVSFQVRVGDSQEIVQQVLSHHILIGIVGSKITDAQISYTPFLEDELIFVAAPSIIRSARMHVNDLCRYPMLLREEGSGTRREAERLLQGQGFLYKNVHVAGIFGSTDAVKQAAIAGLGITILSKLAVTEELKHRLLTNIKLDIPPLKRMFYIATHRKRALPHLYSLFLDHLRSSS